MARRGVDAFFGWDDKHRSIRLDGVCKLRILRILWGWKGMGLVPHRKTDAPPVTEHPRTLTAERESNARGITIEWTRIAKPMKGPRDSIMQGALDRDRPGSTDEKRTRRESESYVREPSSSGGTSPPGGCIAHATGKGIW